MNDYGTGKVLALHDQAGTLVKLRSVISSGQQGTVYRAYDMTRKKEVALKLLTPGYCRGYEDTPRSQMEAQIKFYRKCKLLSETKGLPQELVLPETVSAMLADGSFLYTMPLLEPAYKPVSWAICLKHRDELTQVQRLELCRQCARVLAALHRERFIFCDISQTNLRYMTDARDGIHVRFIDCENITRRGRTLGLQGTGLYRAPELLHPDPDDPEGRPAPPSVMSDIFAFAVLSFRILCFGHPLGGTEVRQQTLEPRLVQSHYGQSPRFIFDPQRITASSRTRSLWNRLPRELKAYYTCMFSPDSCTLRIPRPPLEDYIRILDNIIPYHKQEESL